MMDEETRKRHAHAERRFQEKKLRLAENFKNLEKKPNMDLDRERYLMDVRAGLGPPGAQQALTIRDMKENELAKKSSVDAVVRNHQLHDLYKRDVEYQKKRDKERDQIDH